MTDYDAIRGKKPTKTELILDFMVSKPDTILTPKEVADGLGFNLRTTVTVLNRLAMEGAISKEARGQFRYHPERRSKTQGAKEQKGVELVGPTFDTKTAAVIYKAIYSMAGESTGPEVLKMMTGLGPDDFDTEAPVESIQNLVRALIDLLGEEIAGDIVNIALVNEFREEESVDYKDLLSP